VRKGQAAFTAPLGLELPASLAIDFVARLAYVSEDLAAYELDAQTRREVRFRVHPGREGKKAEIAERIALVARRMCEGYRPIEATVHVSHRRQAASRADPHGPLAAAGELHEYGAGRFGFGPRLTALMRHLDDQLRGMGATLGADEHQFPALVGSDVLDRCQYLHAFPHALTLASHLREDLDAIQSFAQTTKWRDGALDVDASVIDRPECLLSPTVCFHWYARLAGRPLDRAATITALGKCFRYEAGNLSRLERLWDFTMREIVFVGSSDEVLEQRRRGLAATVSLFDEWELSYEIVTATDPFFIEEYGSRTAFQNAFDLKQEVRVDLPFNRKTMAAGSLNFHQDFFGRAFDIRDASGSPRTTGCIGFGLERVALAVVAQHGVDPNAWPPSLRGTDWNRQRPAS